MKRKFKIVLVFDKFNIEQWVIGKIRKRKIEFDNKPFEVNFKDGSTDD